MMRIIRMSLRSFSSHLTPKTRPRTSPPSPPRPPSQHSLSSSISAVPITQLTIDRLRVLCRPVFEEERLKKPMLAWAGISVQRGTQRLNSDVNFLVGYAAGAYFFYDTCDVELRERLPKIIGREIDLLKFIQDDYNFGYVDLEALLTAKTIWGDPLWVQSSREAAERQLREGYGAMKKALQVAAFLEAKLPSSQAEFVSPGNKALRLSILADALFVITTLKIPENPFYCELSGMIPWLLAKEDAIRAALEGGVESSEDLGDIWNVVSDWINVAALEGMMQAAEQTFSRAGLEP